jgi:hypothetical protein
MSAGCQRQRGGGAGIFLWNWDLQAAMAAGRMHVGGGQNRTPAEIWPCIADCRFRLQWRPQRSSALDLNRCCSKPALGFL